VTLLSWFELHTPRSHQDRADLENAIETLTELDKCIKEVRVKIAMPVQYELRRLFHLMNIQTHRNSTQKALFLGAYFNS